MLEQTAQSISIFLQNNPHWGGIITFLIAFSESLAIIGSIIPGSVTMTAVGVLIGTKILPPIPTLLWAIAGAFIGDLLSYWIGVHYNERLRNIWPFRKHPDWLLAGESFFKKHGGKSILIGRFVGPIRSLIPLIAGLMHMNLRRFIIAALPASALWALIYMFPGVLLGALSLQLPKGMATKFILLFLLVIVLLTLLAWSIKHVFQQLHQLSDQSIRKLWRYLRTKRSYSRLVNLIENRQNVDDHQQLSLLIVSGISLLFFLIVLINVTGRTGLFYLNQPIFEFLRSLRSPLSDKIMIGFTFLGDGHVLLPAGLIILFVLCFFRHWRIALHWFILLGITFSISTIIKHFVHCPRPTGLFNGPISNSFPSGHTFSATLFFGFLVGLITTHIKKPFWKSFPYYIAAFIITLVAFSRLYLGVHWLTDILGSITLGLVFVALGTISYRRNAEKKFPLAKFNIIVVISILSAWLVYFIGHYHKIYINYTPVWPTQTITTTSWWGAVNKHIPTYRINRLGKPSEPLNIQWADSPEQIKDLLINQDWKIEPTNIKIKEKLLLLANKSQLSVTLLPLVHNNQPPILVLTKEFIGKKRFLILRLWDSKIYLNDAYTHLLVGNISLNDEPTKPAIYSTAIINFTPYLKQVEWIKLHAPIKKHNSKKMHWDGELLQIRSPGRD